jgi:PAS domain-containing protein
MRTLTAIFDATTDFVVQSDREGLLTYMNPAARRVVGLAEDAPIGHLHALSFNPPEDGGPPCGRDRADGG